MYRNTGVVSTARGQACEGIGFDLNADPPAPGETSLQGAGAYSKQAGSTDQARGAGDPGDELSEGGGALVGGLCRAGGPDPR